ncbi:NYN domain-containing protein [Candidatus Falkowbacteria bacterium]|nr:NYN domain-containing protein [Candidatus Falkowbacteria bacterium]
MKVPILSGSFNLFNMRSVKRKKAIVFIDGSNFYFRLKELTEDLKHISLLNFNYRKFSEWLCRDFELINVRYYVGAVRRKKNNFKSEEMYNNQQKLFRRLRKNKVNIIEGQLIQHPDKIYHEKGVDVRIAVEMIRFARQNKYDTAVLVSSDNDLIPAVEEVFSFNKKVKYVCAVNRRSFLLSKAAGDYLVLKQKNIRKFLY